MDNTREKLIQFIEEEYYCSIEEMADHMIANGVTLNNQALSGKWISVKDRLPEEDIRVLVFTKESIYGLGKMDTDRLHNNRWVRWNGCVTHWMPLPEPPNEVSQ